MELYVIAAAGALLARLGFTVYATGLSRSKNAAGAAMRSLFDLCLVVLVFWAIGAAVLLSHQKYAGLQTGMLLGRHATDPGDVFFYAVLLLTASGAVGGATAERAKFFSMGIASILLAAVIYPLAGHWIWTGYGWLNLKGFTDIGGASAIHLSVGVCAAVAAIAVGARTGKYHRDGSASMIPGHNVPLAAAGALTVLVGWFPYLAVCAVRHNAPTGVTLALANTLLAGAAAGLAGLLLGHFRYGKPDVVLTVMAFLGGLVAISAGAATVNTRAAIVVGAVTGVIVPLSAVWIDLLGRIDDPVGAVSIHGVAGLWGTVAAGLFMPGSTSDRLRFGGIQLMGAIAIIVLSGALSAIIFFGLQATVGLRSREADEFDGLDLAEHDIGAYPDFQQTMIKSYHLREA